MKVPKFVCTIPTMETLDWQLHHTSLRQALLNEAYHRWQTASPNVAQYWSDNWYGVVLQSQDLLGFTISLYGRE